MMPFDHLKHSTWFSLVLALFLDLPSVAVVFLASLLIDIDHWLWSIWAFGHWSPLKAARWHRQSLKDQTCFTYHICCLFHTVEFLSLLGVAATFSPFARAVFLGFLFHVACDLFHHLSRWQSISISMRIKYLLTPFLPKLARGEVFATPAVTPAKRR